MSSNAGAITTNQGFRGRTRRRVAGVLTNDRRFRIETKLGEGGMGTVYLAFDHERDDWVALKLLRRVDGQGIYRIKKEFRTLAGLRHEHLVSLYELFEQRGDWFFTMEYVEGEPLLDVLHASDSLLESDVPRSAPGPSDKRPRSPARDTALLRRSFLQVAKALRALHDAGKLHRDVKPENVMIAKDGRVVVLDFGIAATRQIDGALDTIVGDLTGTPAYIAPEQARGAPPEAASDWYAFGVMLFEALTDEVPFDDGSYLALLQRKQEEDPEPPSTRARAIPEDLDELCLRLLARDPARRPSALEVIEVLSTGTVEPPAPSTDRSGRLFVGRAGELSTLEKALDSARVGKPTLAVLHGASGIGKSTLARRFLQMHAEDRGLTVLTGRCYEHEAIAFKGFDAVVDSLSRFLGRMPTGLARKYLPRRLDALCSVFPVLGRIEVVATARRRRRHGADPEPAELRRLAFAALRDLLARITLDHEVVVFVDDLQWGDVDSIDLLEVLTSGADAPPVLWLLNFSDDDAAPSPCRDAVERYRERQGDAAVFDVAVGPLDRADAAELTRSLAGQDGALDVERLVDEAQGNPYLLTELLLSPDATTDARAGPGGIEGALGRRLATLSRGARELLALLAIAGRPLPRRVYRLVQDHGVDLHRAVAELRAQGLLRSAGRAALTVYHDRMREAAIALLERSERTRWHLRLARALEAEFEADLDTDLELLVHHFTQGGEPAKGARYAVMGARRAAEDFAFDRAARLYESAIEAGGWTADERGQLLRELAEALVLSGRRTDAASTWLWAAQGESPEEAAALRRRAGQALVLAGHSERGIPLLRDALHDYGLTLYDDVQRALEDWFERIGVLRSRGLHWVARRDDEVSEAARRRLDTLWAASAGLLRVLGVRAYPIATQYLLEALEHGDRSSAVRGLCFHHAYVDLPLALTMKTTPPPTLAAARGLLEDGADRECEAWLVLAEGTERWLGGEFEALPLLERAETLFMACPGTTFERAVCAAQITHDLITAHRWSQVQEHCRERLADAVTRDDQAMTWIVRVATVHEACARGQHERGRDIMARARAEADHIDGDVRFVVEAADVYPHIIAGDTAWLARFMRKSERYLASAEGRLPRWRIHALLRRVACRLELARRGDDVAEHHFRAKLELDEIAQAALPRFMPTALGCRAALARQRGRDERAAEHLHTAIELCTDAEPAQALHYEYALARLAGGQDGEARARRALAALADHGLEDLALLAAHYPGLID